MKIKIKYPLIILFFSIYFIGIVLTFSGNLITQIQNIRHQNQIEKINDFEILEFSISEWHQFSDINEINFKNNYYDVISYAKLNNVIIAKVLKDNFENEISISISKIFKNDKNPISEKKKSNSFSKHLFSKNIFYSGNTIEFILIKLHEFDNILTIKTSNFINLNEKPPC